MTNEKFYALLNQAGHRLREALETVAPQVAQNIDQMIKTDKRKEGTNACLCN